MYRLIIDSSTKIMYVGLTQNLNLIDKKIRIAKRDHAKYLVDEIDQLLSKNNLKITDIKEIIVGNGPGSYTGLRVAGMVAKMLAYIKNIILKEVASPFFLTSGYEEKVTGLIDARRNQFFMGTYDNLTTVIPEQIGQLDDFYTNNDFLESRKVLIDENNYLIDAAKIILKATIVEDVHSYTPNYIRKTEAERNYDQKSEI